MANCVTLATCVKSDILRAVGQKCSKEHEEMFVIGFTSHPVLQIMPKDGSGQYALTFVDAVAKFGSTRGYLHMAYGRAGTSFNG